MQTSQIVYDLISELSEEDNWKTDIVMTINLRSLKNFFDLRDSGAAWFQIQWLAQAMKEATPQKYLKLIDKKYKNG